jgi:hypothetical protein
MNRDVYMQNIVGYIRTGKSPHETLAKFIETEISELQGRLSDDKNIKKFDLLKDFLSNLKSGEYHDFLNDFFPAPKTAMIEHLRLLNYELIAQLVIDGIFDEDTNTNWKNEKAN